MKNSTTLIIFVLLTSCYNYTIAQQKDFPIKVSKVIVDIPEGAPIEVTNNDNLISAYLQPFRSTNSFYADHIKSLIEEQLVNQEFDVLGWGGLFPELEEQKEPLLALGAVIQSFMIKRSGGESYNNYSIEATIKWKALDLNSNQIIYNKSLKVISEFEKNNIVTYGPGFRYENHSKQIELAFFQAVDQLLADSNFQQLLQKKQASPVGIGDSTPVYIPAFKLAQSSNFLEHAIKGTVTIKSPMGFGSGFFINNEGLILSCYHNFKEARPVKVYLGQGVVMEAEVVKTNPEYDIALLQLKGVESSALPLGKSNQIKVGSEAYVIGTPANQALNQSVSKGIISGNRTIESKNYLQTDASVSPGNSGGPIINSKGEVIGIVNAKVVGFGAEGIGFAIPIELALEKLNIQWSK